MSTIVAELQRDALNPSIKASDLLRKALVVSHKLGLTEMAVWIRNELEGYKDIASIPEYRLVEGELKGWNPYRGWIPVYVEDASWRDTLTKRENSQAIAELEHLLESKAAALHMPFPSELELKLAKSIGVQTKVTLFVPNTHLTRILDTVRTIVLNWALKLEEEGIVGKDFAFTTTEKETAAKSAQIITNFYGPVTNSQIQQGGTDNEQIKVSIGYDRDAIERFLSLLNDKIDEIALSSTQKEELTSEVSTVKAQIKSPKPKSSIIGQSLRTIRSIIESAGGSVVAALLMELAKNII